MKRIMIATCLVALVSAIGYMFAQQSSANAEQTLMNMEREWANAWMKGDATVFDRVEANDFVGVDAATGDLFNKVQDVASIKNGEWKVQSVQLDDMKVRFHGDTAIVTGRFLQKAQFKGADRSYTGRFVDTWVNRGGQWQVVGSGSARITQ